ncbi:MAG: hypothetical protein HOE44_09780, partial [Candidatus Marinimicrobia bacterium]|nr:hypothetical protein [Candidatus Neomarinimicrobiota bacterium]
MIIKISKTNDFLKVFEKFFDKKAFVTTCTIMVFGLLFSIAMVRVAWAAGGVVEL